MERSEVVAGLAVAAGGALGAAARWGLGVLLPWRPPGFPWATFAANLVGAALIGVVLVLLTEVVPGPGWLRPFLATGVLGGFTTFSAFAVESVRLADTGAAATAAAYVVATVAAGLALVRVSAVGTRRVVTGRAAPGAAGEEER